MKNAQPVAAPVAPATRRGHLEETIAQALADAAQCLLKAANVLLGETPVSVLPSPKSAPVALPGDFVTVREMINQFLIAKARAGRSDRYLRQLRVTLSSFADGRAGLPLAAVTVQDVEKWLYGLKLRPRTMKGYLGDVRTLFHFAERRGHLQNCSAVCVELPASDTKHLAPGVHTPEQVKIVLETARAYSLDVCRHLAVRYFAGIRTAEAHRLREGNILLDRGLIEVPALASKTRSRRLVKIQPCLAAWLALGGTLRPIRPDTIRAAIRASQVKWEPNATRHSFVTYHLAAFENAGRTALQAGHDERILFAHYNAVATKDQGERYFAIVPE